MTNPDSTYAKPFLTVPAQIHRLRERGMDCQSGAFATAALERYGYYRLSGYWHLYRELPPELELRTDEDGREIRLDTFVQGTNLPHVVALYDFDHALRTRLGETLSTIEISIRYFIGHRLGRRDKFAHRKSQVLGAVRDTAPDGSSEPKTSYNKWLTEYDRHENRARDAFVLHFRRKYGPHLPIWVATEVMSFGVLSNLYTLMPQVDQEILAARLQINTADGKGDRGAMANWLNSLRHVRNICAHYGRVWNRTFDVDIDAPGQARKDSTDHLAALADTAVSNKLYGVLLIVRHLLLSIAPDRNDALEIAQFITGRAKTVRFDLDQLGFPAGWEDQDIWKLDFTLASSPMRAASLLDRVETYTTVEARSALTAAEVAEPNKDRSEAEWERALKAAQRKLLGTYLHHNVLIEIELGGAKHYPAFQFRGGKIIDALAEINQTLFARCGEVDSTETAGALLDWWQTPNADLPTAPDGSMQAPADLLATMVETDFDLAIEKSDAMTTFRVPASSE
ncbi:Abi family protein [Microbacterium sp. A204]|uniref:Abi family protein n=1 Tax=Microbacterium sp. A204 TaxID=3457321 RepID=UPI003FD46AC8